MTASPSDPTATPCPARFLPAVLPDPGARELDPLERWYWLFDKVSPLNGVVRCRVRGELRTGAVAAALRAMQRRHPLLRAKIVANGRDGRPRFVIDDSLVLPIERRAIGEDGSEEAWVDIVRGTVLNTRFDTETGPLVRLLILDREDGADVIAYGSHTVFDATGAMSFLRELLRTVEGVDPEQALAFPLTPGLGARFPAREHGLVAFLRALSLQVRREVWTWIHRPRRLSADRAVPFEERRTDFLHRRLDEGQTAALVEACRAHGTSVQGALGASLLLAMAADMRERGEARPDEPLTLGVGSPVTLRDALEPPAHEAELGIFVGTFMTWIRGVGARGFWDMARELQADLRRQAAAGDAFTILNFVKKTMPRSVARAGGYMRLLDAKGPGNACISNLGRYDFPAEIGSLKVSGAQMIAECSVTGTWVGVVNTCHGELVWNMSYVGGIFTRERATRLADRCIERLLAEIAGQRQVDAAQPGRP